MIDLYFADFFWFGPSRLITQGLSVRQYIDAMIKEMYPFGACSLFVKKLPSFWPIQTGKGNILF
jgi:hypothetical protein